MQSRSVVLLATLAALASFACAAETGAPQAMREMRGVWVATVANIDWPSTNSLSSDQQKQELVSILDKCVQLNMNVVVLQVRPACDAMYNSKLEPWSDFLTGKMGQAPKPYYDPLEFAVTEAHNRGLELHAWFNPYRAHHPASKSPISSNHVSKTHPDVAKKYGGYLWLDPGEPYVQKYSHDVIMDVVRRYDIDGVHMDDYFYPYKEKGPDGKIMDFPDEPSWKKYQQSGGTLKRDDWRRENVNKFVRDLYASIKEEKPNVKFGISPFGIWQPGYPKQITGFNQYSELYADAKKWLEKGWVDYFTPQLYWKVEQTSQSYPVLLKWWIEQNQKKRAIVPGNFTSQVMGEQKAWPVSEIVKQIQLTRELGAQGNIHFSMKPFMKDSAQINETLLKDVYGEMALVPPCPWLDTKAPGRPSASRKDGEISFKKGSGEKPWLWVVYAKNGDKWNVKIVPGVKSVLALEGDVAKAETLMVSAVDRFGNESEKAQVSGK